ncbi:MAG: hypothetical protein AAGA81_10670 [Acidobacteriota bacterium]
MIASHSFSTRRFLGHEPPDRRGDYWNEVFADLHRRAGRWLTEQMGGGAEAPTWHSVASIEELPPEADCVLMTHASHQVDGPAVLAALRSLEERGVHGLFLVLDHQPAALRALAGGPSTPSLDPVELLRRTHIETDFSLRRKGSFPARLCRTEVLQLARRGDLGRGGSTADFFHGCSDLYQVLEA